jgi:2-oxoisovalerate dehydrogenase E2 component (dihydrolipoyl transacylase)
VAKVTMPQLGESVAEGTIGKWLKQPGDHVDKYEPLLEVITDKVNAEVPSPFEGVLKEILAEEGATVPNNAEIAIIETGDDAGSSEAAATPPAEAAAPKAVEEAKAPEESKASEESKPASAAAEDRAPAQATGPAGSDESNTTDRPAATAASATPSPAATATAAPAAAGAPPAARGDAEARMTPAVRRLLREHALRPEQIVGTGGGGRITRDDVLAVVEAIRTGATPPVAVMGENGAGATAATAAQAPAPAAQSPQAAPPAAAPTRPTQLLAGSPITFPEGADEVLLPMTQMRKGISAKMTRALQVPHAYVHMEVDVTALVKLREGAKRDYQAREGISLSYVPFVIKATVDGLRRFPAFNAHWTDEGILAKRRINMGVAVAVDEGLIVPVVRDVDQLSISGLNRAIADVAARARAGKFKVDDFGGGTFTIDNTGWFGSNLTMPIINVPEVAILTMEAITKRPVVQETPDGDVIAIRPVMNMVLAIDHRANDGAQAAAFLKSIKSWLESVGPETPIY